MDTNSASSVAPTHRRGPTTVTISLLSAILAPAADSSAIVQGVPLNWKTCVQSPIQGLCLSELPSPAASSQRLIICNVPELGTRRNLNVSAQRESRLTESIETTRT